MSAAEKLKALDMGGTEDDAELCTMGKVDVLALRDALPQIVAVVDLVDQQIPLAKKVRDRFTDDIGWPATEYDAMVVEWLDRKQKELAAALAALDEALS